MTKDFPIDYQTPIGWLAEFAVVGCGELVDILVFALERARRLYATSGDTREIAKHLRRTRRDIELVLSEGLQKTSERLFERRLEQLGQQALYETIRQLAEQPRQNGTLPDRPQLVGAVSDGLLDLMGIGKGKAGDKSDLAVQVRQALSQIRGPADPGETGVDGQETTPHADLVAAIQQSNAWADDLNRASIALDQMHEALSDRASPGRPPDHWVTDLARFLVQSRGKSVGEASNLLAAAARRLEWPPDSSTKFSRTALEGRLRNDK